MLQSFLYTKLLKSSVHATLTAHLKFTPASFQVLNSHLGLMAAAQVCNKVGILPGFQAMLNKYSVSLVLYLCTCCYTSPFLC